MGVAGGFLLVFAVTAGLTPLLMRRAEHWRMVAHPSDRKLHNGAIPLVGGLAMGLAFLIAYVAQMPVTEGLEPVAIAGAVGIALVGGVLDDRHELSARYKFCFQIVAATVLALSGDALLTHLGHLMTENLFTLGRWSLPLTIFAVVGVMNAINMADGLDGLAGSMVLAACLGFGYAAVAAGDAAMFAAICLTAGAVAGFLVHNARMPWRGSAAVYMGDTGSMLLGLLLAWFAIKLAMSERAALSPITAVWILGLPIADCVTIMIRRILRGRSPFAGDREHLHHIVQALGFTPTRTMLTLFLGSLSFCIVALAAQYSGVPDSVMFYAYVGALVGYCGAAEVLCRRLGLRPKHSLTK